MRCPVGQKDTQARSEEQQLAIGKWPKPTARAPGLTSFSNIDIHLCMPTLSDKQLVDALKAIADPTRLKILRLLKQKGCCSIGKGEGMCACDIEEQVKLSQPTISHHMAILRKAGLIHAEKQGLWMWYRRNEKSLKELGQAVNAGV
jgi:ArsR family transcriptional regulator, arsenate/arsenite/antimonite-responsive transcriptional repressor